MANKITEQFIKIQNKRYRLNTIKRYTPFETDKVEVNNDQLKTTTRKTNQKWGIYVYFSTQGNNARVYHYFDNQTSRDNMILRLDQAFNIIY